MIAQVNTYTDFIENLPSDSFVVLRNKTWEDYEELLEEVGEASHLRISFDEGEIQIMTLSIGHERFERTLEKLIGSLALQKRIEIASFGSATMKKSKKQKGSEPNASFYFQNSDLMMHCEHYDFEKDPPPDVVVEIDIHHESLNKFKIYKAFGVPEFWLFDGEIMTIYALENDEYVSVETSKSLPMLSAETLTHFLNLRKTESELNVLIAFEDWLKTL